ncbi:MAG: hypothetical protein AMXMBFR58_00970 [Phycisphaerae bacterium]|nr:hypothetical protein [Phycisphaerales bacterium]
MSAADTSKKLSALLKRLRTRYAPAADEESEFKPSWIDPLMDEVIYSFLLWDATTPQARNAFKRLREAYIDYNELRVSLPAETVAVLGERYPRGEERAARLRAALFDLYKREYAVSLKSLADGGKRDIRAYLESLEGTPCFVVDRVMQRFFGAHAIAIDERLRDLLADEGVVNAETAVEDAASWLARQIKAEEAGAVCQLLRAWADDESPEPRRPKPPAARSEGEPKNRAKPDRAETKTEERAGRRRPARKKASKGGES